MIDDEPTLVIQEIPALSRRERRLERGRARRSQMLVGWFGYGVIVVAVIAAASWLAVRGGSPLPPKHAHTQTTHATTPGAALRPVTPATGAQTQTVSVPAAAPETQAPAATTTTTPVVAAVATPTP